jgi:hypothetical protein
VYGFATNSSRFMAALNSMWFRASPESYVVQGAMDSVADSEWIQ